MLKVKNEKEISEEELWLTYSTTKSIESRNQLVTRYSHIVKYIASRVIANYKYFNYLDDIINEGLIALLNSVEKFDISKNVKFETFASIKIKGAIIDYIRKQDCFPRRIKKLAKTLKEAESFLSTKYGRSPTQQELADYLGITLDELGKNQLEVYSLNVLSFEQVVYESVNDDSALEINTINTFDTPEQVIAENELYSVISKQVEELNEKEQLVIALYYKEQIKIKDIAQIMNISDSRVSQIHSQALKKLKSTLETYMQE